MGCEMFTKWRNVGNIGVNVGNNNPCIESNMVIRSLSLLKNDNTMAGRKRTKRQHYIVKQRLTIPRCNQKLYV
jgi:hypothetical protein